MSETQTPDNAAKEKKAPPVVTTVKMEDGREVNFVGKRRMLKSSEVGDGGVTTRFDFVNGATRTISVDISDPLALKLLAHGIEQKVGDETAGVTEVDDMVLNVENIMGRLAKGEWGVERKASDGFAGASIVVRAIMEATGKSVIEVKEFLERKLEAGKEAGLTRQKLYEAFRNPKTKTAPIIARLEAEKAAKASGVDGDAALAELVG